MSDLLYPEMTGSIWLHDLAPEYVGDSIDLDEVDVTFAIVDRFGTIVETAVAATKVGTSFRLVFQMPDTPGRYKVLARATSGTSVGRFVKGFIVNEVTDETP
jgi:hypothetical protein